MTGIAGIIERIEPKKLLLTLVSRGLSTVFSFALIVSLARIMSADEYGLYALLFSLASALGLVLTAGQTNLLLKHFQRDKIPADPQNRQLIYQTLRWQSAAVLFAWLIGTFLAFTSVTEFSPEAIFTLLIFATVFMGSEYLQCYFRANDRMKMALLPRENVWRPLATAIVWIGSLGGLAIGGSQALLIVAACLTCVIAVQIAFFLADQRTEHATEKVAVKPHKKWRKESVYFALNSIMTAVALHIEVILVGFVLGLEEVALFFILFRLTMLLNLPQISMETIATPMVAERIRNNEFQTAQKLLSAFATVTFILSLIGAIVIVPLAPLIVKLFNPEFETTSWLMAAMASQMVIAAYFGLGTSTLMINGGERFFLIYRSVMYLVYAPALVLLGLWASLAGVAVAMALFVLIEHVIAAIWCKKRTGLDMTPIGLLKSRSGQSHQV